MTGLRQITLEELRRRNYAESTIHIYKDTLEPFGRHLHRSPDQLGREHMPVSGRAVLLVGSWLRTLSRSDWGSFPEVRLSGNSRVDIG